MIVSLANSTLFSGDPDARFSREVGVPRGVWAEMYRRHVFLGYTSGDLRDYLLVKTGKALGAKALSRWLWRSEVYAAVAPLRKKGVQFLESSYFGGHEWRVVRELTKNARGRTGPRALP
jgi:hypothetical protein